MLTASMMANSDYIVLETLKQLVVGRQSPLTYEEIAAACPVRCSERTVRRAVKRLEAEGFVKRTGKGRGRGNGFVYDIPAVS